MTYGLGQISPGLPQLRGVGPSEGIFSSTGAMGGKYNLGNIMKRMGEANALKATKAPAIERLAPNDFEGATKFVDTGGEAFEFIRDKTIPGLDKGPGKILETIKKYALDPKILTGLAAGTLGATALMGNMEPEEIQDMQRGEGLDVEGIRVEVIEAMKDPSGEKLAALRSKYPFLGTQRSKNMAMGGRIGKAEGGIMDLGGMEKDYRNTGGFVDIGEYEKKDDVPARLSVNEFVMTADAVRGMGDGDIDLGAKRMENLMGAMENKKGAQQMFDVSERLSEVV